ncbi:MAG: DUF4011 domain-containing protein [Phycisphaera sp.]|nr:DUF4011 domain-containing protein [Phycisphaera sp.]
MTETEPASPVPPLECRIELDYNDRVNFAVQQSGAPLIDSIRVTNAGAEPIEDLVLTARLMSGIADTWTERLARIEPGVTAMLTPSRWRLSAESLATRTEGERTAIGVRAESKGRSSQATFELDLLAFDQWPGGGHLPELTAAFVTPNHSLIAELLKGARRILGERDARDAIDGYQSASRQRAALIAEACFLSLAEQGIGYINPPASFEKVGQRVRLVDRVMRERFGTCLDLSLALMAMWEQAGLNTILLLPEGHALPAFWTHDSNLPETVIDEPARIRNLLELGDIVAVESTLVTHEFPAFVKAVESGRNAMNKPGSVFCAIDLKACRKRGIRPLPLRDDNLPGIDPVAISNERATGGAAALESVLLAERADAGRPVPNVINEPVESGYERIARWQSRLLDLSLRNRLINFRDTQRSLPLCVPDIARLEDMLASEERFRILPKVEGDDAFRLEELEDRRLYSDCAAAESQKRLLTIYRSSLASIEETGANLLHLALGTLVWYETPSADTPRSAPLVLIPVRLVRTSTGGGYMYTIELSDEPAKPNITLLEKLHNEFGIDARSLAELPEDEAGIDIPMVLRNFRHAIRETSRWEVVESAHLGLFSFNKFLMWRDLKENLGALRENRLVDHLVERPGAEFDTRPFPDASSLDDRLPPGMPMCTRDADSSQLVAVCAASEGRSFVLEGPPGTGKSQTIANMIADALANGKRVLFVAEKLAALSVVRKRLEQDRLGPFCLELHSAKASKKEVLEQLRQALDTQPASLSADWKEQCKQLGSAREQLNRYVDELHRKRDSGESLYNALGTLSTLGDQPVVGLPVGDPSAVTAEQLAMWRSRIAELSDRCSRVHPARNHPLMGIGVSEWEFGLTERVSDAMRQVTAAFMAFEQSAHQWFEKLGIEQFTDRLSGSDMALLADIANQLASSPSPPLALLIGRDAESMRSQLRKTIELGRQRDVIYTSLGEVYQPEFLAIDHLTYLDAAKRARDQISIIRYFRARSVRGKLRVYAKAQVPALPALISDLERAIEANRFHSELLGMTNIAEVLGTQWNAARPDWTGLESVLDWCSIFAEHIGKLRHHPELVQRLVEVAGSESHSIGSECKDICEAHQAWATAWEASSTVLATNDLRAFGSDAAGWLGHVREVLDRWPKGLGDLNNWCVYNTARDAAIFVGLNDLVTKYESGELTNDQLSPVFEASYAKRWFTAVANSVEAIRTFNADLRNSQIERFQALDKDVILLTRTVVAGKLADASPSASSRASAQSEVGILRRELEKKRRHMPTRRLIEKLPNLLPRLKPCFLMSPLSVAQFLDPAMPRFDIVVFDEASQIPVWDAVGAIARGSEVIVVGDSKQLPPTSFFRTIEGGDEYEEAEDAVDDMESILKECNASGVPALRLKWHYRSRHESLIAFSNYHYYQNELMTFPSPEQRSASMGVTFRYVNDGVYDRGGTRTNRIEAERVVEAVVRMLTDERDTDSIGIVTFNQAQQTLIQDMLDEQRRAKPEIERFFTNEVEEPVFVKNLENVQGDERDTIIFSVGYGPDDTGRPSMNFGPLNKEGGERRLNVAVTRAKRRLIVFSSMTSDMIDLRRTRVTGVRHFKQFLDYAERGPESLDEFKWADAETKIETRFEHALREKLIERGYEVDERIGCAGYRIDLAIRDKKDPGRYLLGIECDGLQYRSANTARDRDRTRPSVLRGLGWNLHRVWSSQWYINPDRCLAEIDAAVVAIQEKRSSIESAKVDAVSASIVASAPAAATKPVTERAEAESPATYTTAKPGRSRVGQRDIYAPECDELLMRWLGSIVETEAPILQDLAMRRLAGFCELASVRDRFRERFDVVLGHMIGRGYVKVTGKTLWNPGDEPDEFATPRVPGDDSDSKRDADQIPPEEYRVAVVRVVQEQFGLPRGDLAKEAAIMLGFSRLTATIAPFIDAAIGRAIADGRLTESDGIISL